MEDLTVFPLIFNYRQFIELVLKNIYRKHNDNASFVTWLNMVSHDLSKIWNSSLANGSSVKSIVQTLAFDDSNINIEDIESIINDFITLDSSSFDSRYPITKANNPVMEQLINNQGQNDQLIINIEAIANNINHFEDMLYYTFDSNESRIPHALVD